MKKYHEISDVHFEGDEMILNIDGQCKRFPLSQVSRVLQKATIADQNNFEISPAGYGIHWPNLDEDISIDGLLGIVHERKQKPRCEMGSGHAKYLEL